MSYLSRDLKEFYKGEMKKTEYTRIAGAIVYPRGVYAVYNTRDQSMLWCGRGEEKTKILLSNSIFHPVATGRKWMMPFCWGKISGQRLPPCMRRSDGDICKSG